MEKNIKEKNKEIEKLQEEYESYVEKIDKTKLTIQKILDKMELEKLALMQEYFG